MSIINTLLIKVFCIVTIYATSIVGQETLLTDTLPEPPRCGVTLGDRLFGGRETTIDEHPWTVLLSYNSSRSSDIGLLCGGSLINALWVVTAAHCVTGFISESGWTLSSARLGEWNTATNPDCADVHDCAPPMIDMRIAESIVHPEYQRRQPQNGNDIALLRLETAVPSSLFVKPICLVRSQTLRNSNLTSGVILGWGRTEFNATWSTMKQKATLNIISNEECDILTQFKTHENHICAFGTPGVGTCNGDSGGPLLVQLKDGPFMANYLVGIISIGARNCGSTPTIFTRVNYFIDWIERTIGDHIIIR